MDNAASASVAIPPVGCPDRVRVLAVDDDPICLTTLTRTLQRCGYEVTAKASPEEALREVQLNPSLSFDLVLSAARTRGTGIDGFALLKHLKNRLPVILYSGEEPVETVMRAIQGGAKYFLTKPLRDEDIINIWTHVVRMRLNANNGADPRKRGSAGGAHDSGEGGTSKKTKFNRSPQLHTSIVNAAHQLRATEGSCPRGIRDLLEAQGDGHHYGSGNVNWDSNCGNGRGTLPSNANMVSASMPQPVQQPMPNTGLFPSNMMRTMDNPSLIRQHAFPHMSRFSYNGRTGGISLSPWPADDDGDLLRSYWGENEAMMQNTAILGMAQGMHGNGAAGQASASQPQDLTDLFSWEDTTGNNTTGTSGWNRRSD